MKKFLFFLGIAATMLTSLPDNASAQSGTRQVFNLTAMKQDGTLKTTADTTTNTDTTYLVLTKNSTMQAYDRYNDLVYYWSIVPGITGTTTGTVVIQGSMTPDFSRSSDPISGWTTLTPNTTFSTADSTSYNSAAAGSGGFGTTAANHRFIIKDNQYRYHRVRLITGGTQTSYITGSVSVLSR